VQGHKCRKGISGLEFPSLREESKIESNQSSRARPDIDVQLYNYLPPTRVAHDRGNFAFGLWVQELIHFRGKQNFQIHLWASLELELG